MTELTQAEKLEKIIEYAIKNGFNKISQHELQCAKAEGNTLTLWFKEGWTDITENEVIFNHDFAKAVWGDSYTKEEWNKYDPKIVKRWRWHLQQLAITPKEDRIDYVYNAIKEQEND